jgi:transketolase
VHHTHGVEVTTGPLGQGFANAVGMAIAERITRARFGAELCNHHVFVIAGDGCLEEGISHEAASLAGHLGLGRLIAFYDDNHITIDGDTALSFSDDTPMRFASYGWNVVRLGEAANDTDLLEHAIRAELGRDDTPTLFVLRSHIGYPSPKYTDRHEAHGNPFEPEEITATKAILGIPDEPFYAPAQTLAASRARSAARGAAERAAWQSRFDAWTGDRAAWTAARRGTGLPGWQATLPTFTVGDQIATRQAIQRCLDASVATIPGLVAGGADLTGNTGTKMAGEQAQSRAHPGGRQLYFGVREHAMGGVMNGMAHHGGILPAGGTFFVFSDYMRGAVRVAALSRAKSIFVWTHDSIGVGEDGPTHQPIEHLASLRAMPDLHLLRPADATETVAAWRLAVDHDGPTALVLSRQATPVLTGTSAEGVARGAYVIRESGDPAITLIGTGTEVALCVEAAELLAAEGVGARVVSMPSWDRFEAQDETYQEGVLAPELPSLSVEAGATFGWSRYADDSLGIDRFGASAPAGEVYTHLGITAANVVTRAKALLSR